MKLTHLYFDLETKLLEDAGREPTLLELYSLNEDSRGNIQKFLKLSPELANKFHSMDSSFSFPLAKAYVIWLKAQNVVDYGGPTQPARRQERAEKDIGMKQVIPELITNYMNELGSKLQSIFTKNSSATSLVNKANSMDDINAIITSQEKKKTTSTDRVLMTFPNGWFWFGPLTDEERRGKGGGGRAAPGSEGGILGHCATDSRGDLYSLRDTQNMPHVTMTWNDTKNRVYQIKGHDDKIPVGKARKYYPYIAAFFKKTGASWGDEETKEASKSSPEEFRQNWGMKYKDPGDHQDLRLLDAQIRQYAGEYKPWETALKKFESDIKTVFANPIVRNWVWDIELIDHAQTFYDVEYTTFKNSFLELLEKHGFSRTLIPVGTFGERTVFFDKTIWAPNGQPPVFPPYAQTKTWAGAIVFATQLHTKASNAEVSADPVTWVSQNAAHLQSFYDLYNNLTGVSAKQRKIKASSMARASFTRPPWSKYEYNTATQQAPDTGDTTGHWDTPDEFFAAHSDLLSKIEKGLERFSSRPKIKERVLAVLKDSHSFIEDMDENIYFQSGNTQYRITRTQDAAFVATV